MRVISVCSPDVTFLDGIVQKTTHEASESTSAFSGSPEAAHDQLRKLLSQNELAPFCKEDLRAQGFRLHRAYSQV